MKHVIITGGAGFIGSHLCDAFLKKGVAVTAVDNLITGRKSNLGDALQKENFDFLEEDITRPISWEKATLVQKYGIQGVLHFACPASPVDFEKLAFEILDVDSVGTALASQLALKNNARFVLASTSEVYGDPQVHPQTEEYFGNVNPIGVRACYDETKRFAEAYVSSMIRLKNLDGGIVRIFNTYGPRMRIDDGRVVPELSRRVLKNQPLPIHGSGKQTRSFCFVDDLVEGILAYFQSTIHFPINLGNPTEHTVLEFAEILQSLSRSDLSIEHLEAREDDPQKRRPAIDKARKHLNWEPRVSLQEGLSQTLDYFRSIVSKEETGG